MKLTIYSLALFLSMILESTLFQIHYLNLIEPGLVVIALVLLGMFKGPREGLIYGVIIGLIQDVSFGPFLGQSAFVYGMIGYLSGYLRSLVMRESVLLAVVMTGISTEVYVWLSFAVSRLFGQLGANLHTVVVTSTRMTLSTVVFTILLYPLYRRLLRKKAKNQYTSGEIREV